MGFQFCHFETILKISLGHCGPLTPTLQFRHLPLQSRQVCRVTFFNCISDGAVNHISPAQFLAYSQQAAMTFSLLLLSHWIERRGRQAKTPVTPNQTKALISQNFLQYLQIYISFNIALAPTYNRLVNNQECKKTFCHVDSGERP